MSATADCGRLAAEGLAVGRGRQVLIRDVDFSLGPGELLTLVGPNGSGKTTLLRVLAGLSLPTAGQVTWDGVPIERLGPDFRRWVDYQGHQGGLKLDLSVEENLRFAAALRATPLIGSLQASLSKVGLSGMEERLTRYLSAGQKRRVALARLKTSSARLWLLDEPFTNLDAAGRRLVETWLSEHLASGGLAVVATHLDLDLDARRRFQMELAA
jgi:heme exporter protein A